MIFPHISQDTKPLKPLKLIVTIGESMQSIQTQFLRNIKTIYQQMIDQNNSTIKQLLNQNQYISNQYKIIQVTYMPGQNYNINKINGNNLNINNMNKSNHFQQNLQESIIQRGEEENLQNDGKSQEMNNQQDYKKVKISSEKNENELDQQQKTTKFQYKPFNGHIQDAPGNTIQLRLIPQFFRTYFLQKIQVDSNPQSMVNKKQLLALYVKWRLNKLPHEQKLKLVAIQINISGHIRNHYPKECQTLRHCYSGMKFKSLDTIVQIMNINLKDHQKIDRQKKTKKQSKVLIKQQPKSSKNESDQYEPNDQDIVSDG